jgi:hypothetical protein
MLDSDAFPKTRQEEFQFSSTTPLPTPDIGAGFVEASLQTVQLSVKEAQTHSITPAAFCACARGGTQMTGMYSICSGSAQDG